jgi:hypothetical protein
MPNDVVAQRQPDGDYKCGECIATENRRMMVRTLGFSDPRVRAFMDEEQRSVDQWNESANRWNDIEKRLGGTKPIMKLKRNRYW